MASVSSTSNAVAYATRVDKVGARYRFTRALRITIIVLYAVISLIPVYWMITAAFKSRPDVVAIPPKVFFTPTIEGFVSLLTKRVLLPQAQSDEYKARTDLNFAERLMADRGQRYRCCWAYWPLMRSAASTCRARVTYSSSSSARVCCRLSSSPSRSS
jgi:hypothetical protein